MIRKILISRTDKIGDVILTLPMLAVIKKQLPEVFVIFLGNSYTRPVLECCQLVDEIIEWDVLSNMSEKERVRSFKELSADIIIHVFPEKKIARTSLNAGIPLRIGTSHRIYHWVYCNSLINLGRKKSEMHEAQLNLQLFKPLGINTIFSVRQLAEFPLLTRIPAPDVTTSAFIEKSKTNIIVHPHSRGSAREWPVEHYISLCRMLPEEKFNIIFAGTETEAKRYRPFLKNTQREIKDAGGQLTLQQYISLINQCDGLIAASTGPLHIAAACGKHAFGIYPPIRPMHPGRWAPIGKNVHVFVKDTICSDCRKKPDCGCMKEIVPEEVKKVIMSVMK